MVRSCFIFSQNNLAEHRQGEVWRGVAEQSVARQSKAKQGFIHFPYQYFLSKVPGSATLCNVWLSKAQQCKARRGEDF